MTRTFPAAALALLALGWAAAGPARAQPPADPPASPAAPASSPETVRPTPASQPDSKPPEASKPVCHYEAIDNSIIRKRVCR